MLSVAEAIAAIVAEVQPLPEIRVPLAEGLGLVLAEDIVSDVDSPPFDKALMDGYAVRSMDFLDGRARLAVIEEVLAGQVPTRPVGAGEATRIMTGAPIPDGADAVVPVEHSRSAGSAGEVELESAVAAGRNILKRGGSIQKGICVLPAGRRLRPQEIGCLAEQGRDRLAVVRRPRVAVLATGDELVSIGATPGPGQIRNSNEAMLVAQLRQMGTEAVPLGVARDDSADLAAKIARGLECDLMLLSGGVSAGKLDLVPAALADAGVRQVFHKVKVKPGQPIWFGVRDADPGAARPVRADRPAGDAGHVSSRRYVFGLPGNPVSSMVCCELFARTAVRRLMGIAPPQPVPFRARLTCDHFNAGNRPTYHPAHWEWTEAGAVVQPVRWVGSADLSATLEANAMAVFTEGDRMFPAGTMVDVLAW